MRPPTIPDSYPLYISVTINVFFLFIILFLVRKQLKKCCKRERQQQNRQDREENYTVTHPILRRPRNHNDYFTLTSNDSLNEETGSLNEERGPILTTKGPHKTSPVPTASLRSQSTTQSAFSAHTTTGTFINKI
jgi:hypothetical protein